MDSFIFIGDYAKTIQSENLQQVIGNNQSILDGIQRAAVEECISYLKPKYDTSQAFQPITKWDKSKTYKAGQTVYLDAPVYDATKLYALGSLTLQNGLVYSNTTAITVAEAFTLSKWSLLGTQYDLYYITYPNSVFDYKSIYTKNTIVFWKDKNYTCQKDTNVLSHEAKLQIGYVSESVLNVFPDGKDGLKYWGVGSAYSVPANTLLTDSKWTQGDNRDQKLLEVCVNIALYKAHMRIAPKNIPELRIINYIGHGEDREVRGQRVLFPVYCACGWLQAAVIGNDITPNLPLLQPEQGSHIRFGGNTKNQNSY